MLTLELKTAGLFDERTNLFIDGETQVIHLEHSLLALSKWESIFEKPFLNSNDRSVDEIIGYVEAMIIDDVVPDNLVNLLDEDAFAKVNNYIGAKRSATWFGDDKKSGQSREVVTSELIYNWLFSSGFPIECEQWHLNRLLTALKIHAEKNTPRKKMSASELAARNRELNAKRRSQYNSPG